jgi:type I restriction enzyme S subunit
MADEWKERQLSELMDITHGFAFPGEGIRDEPSRDILLTPGNFAIGGGFKGDKFKYFAGEAPPEYVFTPGDLVVTMTDLSKQSDTLGYPAIVPDSEGSLRFLHNQRVGKVLVKSDANLDKRFLFYLLRTSDYRHEVLASSSGTSIKHTSPKRILAYKASIPPLNEQLAIACILGALDDKIELNRRRNRTLEAIARAIFQSWFVDFDPVKAKAAGRKPAGLSKEIAALFPDSFSDSPLGPIPTGWRVGSILEIADLLSGGTPKTSEPSYWDGDIPWASAKDVSQCGEAFLIDTERTITQEGLQNSATQIIPAFSSVVVARGATTGRMTMFGHDIAMNQTCYALKSEFDAPLYLYLLLRHEIDAIVHTAHGSVFDTITTATFRASKVCIAAPQLARELGKRASPMFDQILGILRQTRTLAAVRDALLPKLISGELRVPDAERIVGRAV